MDSLFKQQQLQEYLINRFNNVVASPVNKISFEELSTYDLEKSVEKYSTAVKVETLEIDFEKSEFVKTVETDTAIRPLGNTRAAYSAKYEYAVYNIPYKGDKHLFSLRPSNKTTEFPKGKIEGSNIIVEITQGNVFTGIEELELKIVEQFEYYCSVVKDFTISLNNEILKFNNEAEEKVRNLLIKKIDEAKIKVRSKSNLQPFKKNKSSE